MCHHNKHRLRLTAVMTLCQGVTFSRSLGKCYDCVSFALSFRHFSWWQMIWWMDLWLGEDNPAGTKRWGFLLYKKIVLKCLVCWCDYSFSTINGVLSISGESCVFVLKNGIGLEAINDSFLLEATIYRLLRRHCREQPYYVHLLELFTEVLYVRID